MRDAGALPPSLPERIRQLIEGEIIELRLAPGGRVTEDELAQRLGVSRTPVREAMRVLEGQGLIVRHRSRGAYVAARTAREEARVLYDLRIACEGHVAARAAEVIDDATVALAEAIQAEFRDALARGSLAELVTLDSDFHWTIYNAAESGLLTVVGSYWGRIQRELYDPVYRSSPELFAAQHELILAALRAGDPDAARRAMAEHLVSGWDVLAAAYRSDDAGPAAEVQRRR
ncbi:MAG TPA: GntR family transcriptional regulator [Conexibacter sp.]|nr:GntR family transcriptional regulator [Conexibacter sp.]